MKGRRRLATVEFLKHVDVVRASCAQTAIGWVAVAVAEEFVVGVSLGNRSHTRAQERLEETLFTLWKPHIKLVWIPSHPYVGQIRRYLEEPGVNLSRISVAVPFSSAFCLRVYRRLRHTVPGQVITYGELAKEAGIPRAARAVGTWMRRNPAPIVIPCHRVIRSDGTVGSYSGGATLKRMLLELEMRWVLTHHESPINPHGT